VNEMDRCWAKLSGVAVAKELRNMPENWNLSAYFVMRIT
jgi:hypothetical protein